MYIETTSFSVSCDAFKNLRDALMLHRTMAAEFLQQRYDAFFGMYVQLLDSDNYVTRRQSLKLLGEILVDRAHYATMVRFVSSAANLKRIMNALRDRSRHIQLEAFHVFKVRRLTDAGVCRQSPQDARGRGHSAAQPGPPPCVPAGLYE